MLLLGGIFLLFLGLLMACFPSGFYDVTQSWKHSSCTEPSGRYLLMIRIEGIIFAVIGIAGIVGFAIS